MQETWHLHLKESTSYNHPCHKIRSNLKHEKEVLRCNIVMCHMLSTAAAETLIPLDVEQERWKSQLQMCQPVEGCEPRLLSCMWQHRKSSSKVYRPLWEEWVMVMQEGVGLQLRKYFMRLHLQGFSSYFPHSASADTIWFSYFRTGYLERVLLHYSCHILVGCFSRSGF